MEIIDNIIIQQQKNQIDQNNSIYIIKSLFSPWLSTLPPPLPPLFTFPPPPPPPT
jgi:hypothetical protein